MNAVALSAGGGALDAGAFLAGALVLAIEAACAATCAALLVGRRAPELEGATRAVALGLVAALALVAIQLVPLALGILTRGTALATAVLLTLAATRVRSSPGRAREQPRRRSQARASGRGVPAEPLGRLLAGAALLLTAAFWLAYLEVFGTYHPVSVDALSFHFPGVIRYLQSGTLWQTAQYLPGQAQANYPQSGDMLLLALVLPWHSLAFVRLADPLLLGLASLAVYGTGRELSAPAPAATLAALALIAIRPTLGPALPDVLTDPAFLAGFAAGNLFLVRHWRTGARAELLLAGAGYGLALGSKWYGLTDVPLVLLAWIAVALVTGRSRRVVARDTGLLVLAVLVTGGAWLLRNLILTGNPVFEYRVSVFGVTLFAAPPDPVRAQVGFTIAHYLGRPGILRHYIWPVLRHDFGWIGLALGAAVLATPLSFRRSPRGWLLGLGAVLCAVAYLLTPYSAQGLDGMPTLVAANTRYGAPALVLAAPLLALLIHRATRLVRLALELALLVLIIAGLHHYLDTGLGRIVLTAAVVLAGAAAMRSAPRTAPAILLALVAVAGFHYQRVLARRPYFPSDPTVDYVLSRFPGHARIAITGAWTAQGLVPVAPLFGPRLDNRVIYIGHDVEHRLQEYARPAPFLRALAAARPELLEVGTGFPPRPDPTEARWAAAAGYRVIVASPRLILMRPPR